MIHDCAACDVQHVHGISVCTTPDIADSNLLSHNAKWDPTWHGVCMLHHLLDLLLVRAAVNGPGRPAPVLNSVGNLVKALLQVEPVAA